MAGNTAPRATFTSLPTEVRSKIYKELSLTLNQDKAKREQDEDAQDIANVAKFQEILDTLEAKINASQAGGKDVSAICRYSWELETKRRYRRHSERRSNYGFDGPLPMSVLLINKALSREVIDYQFSNSTLRVETKHDERNYLARCQMPTWKTIQNTIGTEIEGRLKTVTPLIRDRITRHPNSAWLAHLSVAHTLEVLMPVTGPGTPSTIRIRGQYDWYRGEDLPDVTCTTISGGQGRDFVRLVRCLVGLRTLDLCLDVVERGLTSDLASHGVASGEEAPREIEDEPVLRVIRKLRGSPINDQLRIRVIIKNYYLRDGRDTIFPKYLPSPDSWMKPANYEAVMKSVPRHGPSAQFMSDLQTYLHNEAANGANLSLFWESGAGKEVTKFNPAGYHAFLSSVMNVYLLIDDGDMTPDDLWNRYLEQLGPQPNPTRDLLETVQGCRTSPDVEDITESDELLGDARDHDDVNALQGLPLLDPIWAPEHPKKWEDLQFWRPGDEFPEDVKAQIAAVDKSCQVAVASVSGGSEDSQR